MCNLNPHNKLLKKTIKKIKKFNIYNILDAGSGRTSVEFLTKQFKDAWIDAVVYKTDARKVKSVNSAYNAKNVNLIKCDIIDYNFKTKYDLVLAHLILGEAKNWGHNSREIIDKIFKIDSTYYVIFDILQDYNVDYEYLEALLQKNNIHYTKHIIKNNNPEIYPKHAKNGEKQFISNNFISYLIKKI